MFMRIADHLRDAGQGGQFFGRALSVAAGYHNFCMGIFAVHTSDGCAGILIGGCRDCASVQDYDPGFGESASALQSLILELALEGGAVGLGRPAPKILYVKTRHHTIVAAHLGPSSRSGTNRAMVLGIKEVNAGPLQHRRGSDSIEY